MSKDVLDLNLSFDALLIWNNHYLLLRYIRVNQSIEHFRFFSCFSSCWKTNAKSNMRGFHLEINMDFDGSPLQRIFFAR